MIRDKSLIKMVMSDLTYAVDVEGRDLTEVAREALEARGLL